MEKTRDYLVRHPVLVAGIFATFAALGAYDTFKAGMAYANMRTAAGNAAREASEALGG